MPKCVPLHLCSPGLVDCDEVTVCVFEPAQLVDELVDLVVSRQPGCVCLDHRDCDRVLLGYLWFCDFVMVSWLCSLLLSVFCVLGWSSSFVTV